MKDNWRIRLWAAAGMCMAATAPTFASFHLMQIEQVIGGVNGDTYAQAIQLRMRFPGANGVEYARIRAWNSNGANPITLIDFDQSVPDGALGARVLIATPEFLVYTETPLDTDFILTDLIPETYLDAGRITYEGDDGTIYWSLSFGGMDYTGPTTGMMFNDPDGEFGPPFDGPLPSDSGQALLFQGIATDSSTSNLADYALTVGAAIFTNNAGVSAPLISCGDDIDLDLGVTLEEFAKFQACFTGSEAVIKPCCGSADFDDNGVIDWLDYALFYDALVEP